MDLGVEGFADITRRAGEVDHHLIGVDVIDGEAVGPKPARDRVEILLRQSVHFSLLCRREPLAEIGRALVGEAVNILVQLLLELGRPLQLQQHVIQGEVVIHTATIIFSAGFRARVAAQPDPLAFIDRLGDENGFVSTVHPSLRDALACSDQRQASQGEDCYFLTHGLSGPWIHGGTPAQVRFQRGGGRPLLPLMWIV